VSDHPQYTLSNIKSVISSTVTVHIPQKKAHHTVTHGQPLKGRNLVAGWRVVVNQKINEPREPRGG